MCSVHNLDTDEKKCFGLRLSKVKLNGIVKAWQSVFLFFYSVPKLKLIRTLTFHKYDLDL